MCRSNVRPSYALQPPSVTSTQYVIVRNADDVSQTWTGAHPVCLPTVKTLWHHAALSRTGGTHTDDD
jgi:hypothetical protein